MRITESRLRQIIREELNSMNEVDIEEEEIENIEPTWGKLGPDDQWLSNIPQGIMTTASKRKIDKIKDTSKMIAFAGPKPVGLWYTLSSAWIDWMRSEQPSWLEDVNYIYEIKPNYDRILRITSLQELRSFGEEYDAYGYGIDWPTVAVQWDGIEINPHQHGYTEEWYRSWDIASGCVWRPSGAQLIETPILSRPGVNSDEDISLRQMLRKGDGSHAHLYIPPARRGRHSR
jgi:hypothetical protein